MTPGTYLWLRREAAGLSIADVVVMISPTKRWHAFNTAFLERIEADQDYPTPGFVDRLRGAFPFDRFVYRQLFCGLMPPPICTSCGCSDLDACDDEDFGPCAWVGPDRDLCTHCARKSAGAITEENDHASCHRAA